MSQISTNLLIPVVVLIAAGLLLMFVGRVPLSYNLLNLQVRWKTTVLTALAFTLVIALLTVMMSFVNGMVAVTENSGQPGNVIILSEGATDESFSNMGYSDVGDIENQPGIERLDGKPLFSRETYLVVNQPINDPPPGRPKRRFLQFRGLDDPIIGSAVHGIALLPGGSWFSEAGVRESTETADGSTLIEAVLGEGIAREMARDRHPGVQVKNPEMLDVGDTFELNERTWIVAGVMQSSGSTFDSEVWAKRSLIGPMFGKESYSTLVARTANAEEALKLKNFLNNDYQKAALAAQLETEYFESLSETSKSFLYAIVVVTVILAIGGVFGIMNTMFAAINQRTADIGVLRILGYRRREILASFLLESLVLAIIGGAVGCLIGSFVDGATATSIVSSGQGGGGKFVVLKLVVDANTVLACALLTLLMGFLGGLIPSLNAMRLSPLEAMR